MFKQALFIRFCRSILCLGLLCIPSIVAAGNQQQGFLAEVFPSGAPNVSTLWLNKPIKDTLKNDFEYALNRVRLRYWQEGSRTVWILEEIGKEQPITMGIVVDENSISAIDVLVYRESRGGEIEYDFFRNQFTGASLSDSRGKKVLSQNIDGITGATLSVRAMTKVAKVALYLHRYTQNLEAVVSNQSASNIEKL